MYINRKYRRQAGLGLTRIFPALDISQSPGEQRSRDLSNRDYPDKEEGWEREGKGFRELDRGTEKGGRNIK